MSSRWNIYGIWNRSPLLISHQGIDETFEMELLGVEHTSNILGIKSSRGLNKARCFVFYEVEEQGGSCESNDGSFSNLTFSIDRSSRYCWVISSLVKWWDDNGGSIQKWGVNWFSLYYPKQWQSHENHLFICAGGFTLKEGIMGEAKMYSLIQHPPLGHLSVFGALQWDTKSLREIWEKSCGPL